MNLEMCNECLEYGTLNEYDRCSECENVTSNSSKGGHIIGELKQHIKSALLQMFVTFVTVYIALTLIGY